MPKAFFLFGDGDLHVEPSLELAAGYMEPIDIENGEYDAVFDDTGRRYDVSLADGLIQLTAADEVDRRRLVRRLREYVSVAGLDVPEGDRGDPMAIAAAISSWEWEHRWPKRPRWLSRRLHGEGPAITW